MRKNLWIGVLLLIVSLVQGQIVFAQAGKVIGSGKDIDGNTVTLTKNEDGGHTTTVTSPDGKVIGEPRTTHPKDFQLNKNVIPNPRTMEKSGTGRPLAQARDFETCPDNVRNN